MDTRPSLTILYHSIASHIALSYMLLNPPHYLLPLQSTGKFTKSALALPGTEAGTGIGTGEASEETGPFTAVTRASLPLIVALTVAFCVTRRMRGTDTQTDRQPDTDIQIQTHTCLDVRRRKGKILLSPLPPPIEGLCP